MIRSNMAMLLKLPEYLSDDEINYYTNCVDSTETVINEDLTVDIKEKS